MTLTACTPGGDEPNAIPVTTPPTPTPEPTAEQPAPTEESASATDEPVTGSSSPAEVDLSQITSQPPENPTPRVAPQPGVPDPAVAVAHQVSQDLAGRLELDVSEVHTVNVTEIEWPDSSLGCPAPDVAYQTVITPGYLIILGIADIEYMYHTDLQGNYLLCGDDGQPV